MSRVTHERATLVWPITYFARFKAHEHKKHMCVCKFCEKFKGCTMINCDLFKPGNSFSFKSTDLNEASVQNTRHLHALQLGITVTSGLQTLKETTRKKNHVLFFGVYGSWHLRAKYLWQTIYIQCRANILWPGFTKRV